MDQNNQKPFSFLNVFYDTIKFILPPNSIYQIQFQQLTITFDEVHIIVLHLGNWLIITFNSQNGSKQLKLNIKLYFQPQITNYYIQKSNIDQMSVYYRQQQFRKLVNIISSRILNFQEQNPLFKAFESKLICYKIISFLTPRDLIRLPLISARSMEIFCSNNFWYNLYNWKFGYTGFQEAALEWRKQYILKHQQQK